MSWLLSNHDSQRPTREPSSNAPRFSTAAFACHHVQTPVLSALTGPSSSSLEERQTLQPSARSFSSENQTPPAAKHARAAALSSRSLAYWTTRQNLPDGHH